MDHQTLYISYVSQQREYLQSVDKFPGLFLSALNLKGEDRSTTVGEVLLVELVVVMTLECRVVHFSNLWMLSQEIYNLKRILHMTLNTQTQCLYTLQQDECVEW